MKLINPIVAWLLWATSLAHPAEVFDIDLEDGEAVSDGLCSPCQCQCDYTPPNTSEIEGDFCLNIINFISPPMKNPSVILLSELY